MFPGKASMEGAACLPREPYGALPRFYYIVTDVGRMTSAATSPVQTEGPGISLDFSSLPLSWVKGCQSRAFDCVSVHFD